MTETVSPPAAQWLAIRETTRSAPPSASDGETSVSRRPMAVFPLAKGWRRA